MTTTTTDLLAYIDAAPTPFHAVAETVRRLEAAGFTRLRERHRWPALKPGDRRFVTRNGSTLVAFVVGSASPGDNGFRLAGAHTDSPNLRLKPHAAYTKEGYQQLGVEVYGGVLLHTWFDRDLSLAGRVFVEGEEEPRLIRIDRNLCRIPNLAIHLNRDIYEKGFHVNKQKHMPPVLGLSGESEEWLKELLAGELAVTPDAILSSDLMLFDVVPSVASGISGEFIHAPRLDNLGSCHAALEALIGAAGAGAPFTSAIALYDHEEVGSTSAEGADSPFLESILERITLSLEGDAEDLHRARARSLFVSADMAHAVHPNYADRHESNHMPRLNGGPVVKVNSNLRYATNAGTGGAFAAYAREVDVEIQWFVNRSDLRCGSTIGPITASRLGVPTVDVGNPMLSMHSIREMAGSQDQDGMIKILGRHFGG